MTYESNESVTGTALDSIEIRDLPLESLKAWLKTMQLIRVFELSCESLALNSRVVSAVHSSAGQEAVAVGSIAALEPHDLVIGPHRTHHHAMAKGMTARQLMAELFGRSTGCAEGRGGTMHLRDVAHGYLGGNGIVGASVGIGLGTALASKIRGNDQVTIAYVGDGGLNTGRIWEAINLAQVWQVPLIVICENNLYAVETATAQLTGGNSIIGRALGFGITAESIDGQDVGAVYRSTRAARQRAVNGQGPTFIEARTYRYEGHQSGQKITYRSQEELELWKSTKDPIERLKVALIRENLLSDAEFESIVTSAAEEVRDAIQFAEESPWPEFDTAYTDVTKIDLKMRQNP
jgi:pyruvate dehydrogenase E1 component alpha subunit